MKPFSIKWLQALDTDEVDEAIEEACVDCYGEDEQCSALADMAGQELAFPFPATVMGEAVEVVDSASSKYDPQGLDLVAVHKGKQYAIAAHCVELVTHIPHPLSQVDRDKLKSFWHSWQLTETRMVAKESQAWMPQLGLIRRSSARCR